MIDGRVCRRLMYWWIAIRKLVLIERLINMFVKD